MLTEREWGSIAGVIFDAVGTLIEPFPPVPDAYARAAERQGVALAREDVRSRFHRHFRDDEQGESPAALVTDEATEARRWQRIVANVLAEVPDQDRAFKELWEHFGQPRAWRCFPDVAAALDALSRSGRAVCIASNFDSRLRTVAAGLAPLRGHCGALVISSEVGFRKPHPAFYQAACDRLRLPAERLLWIGDHTENDLAGPIRHGLRAVLLERRGQQATEGPRWADLSALADLA